MKGNAQNCFVCLFVDITNPQHGDLIWRLEQDSKTMGKSAEAGGVIEGERTKLFCLSVC